MKRSRRQPIRVPVKLEGITIGMAEISEDGQIITAELDSSAMSHEIRDMLVGGVADSLTIRPNCSGYTTHELAMKKALWEQHKLPYGM